MTDLGPKIPSSEITPESAANRRSFLKSSLLFTATAAGVGGGLIALTHAWRPRRSAPLVAPEGAASEAADGTLRARPGPFATSEPRTPLADITGYNNFYEFGTSKEDPARRAGRLRTRPWTL